MPLSNELKGRVKKLAELSSLAKTGADSVGYAQAALNIAKIYGLFLGMEQTAAIAGRPYDEEGSDEVKN